MDGDAGKKMPLAGCGWHGSAYRMRTQTGVRCGACRSRYELQHGHCPNLSSASRPRPSVPHHGATCASGVVEGAHLPPIVPHGNAAPLSTSASAARTCRSADGVTSASNSTTPMDRSRVVPM